jgi:two-component system invasion response regulator UvrY
MQVMLMLTRGQNAQTISRTLNLSPKTVCTYRYRLYEKLDVRNDVELTHLAIRHGLITGGKP